ncbi:FAD-dependent oxidoreductase [Actinoplanes ianthinogenes]|uniref:FAD-dependent oxidoreductase n=1 Tax=Actinoplanes ianthinogenes TaxID=122358 RepID=A0ABM7LPH3_9ACTN|nr:FAD-dependent monooxygenase [Actinoplanes ianthinogenes]BCJ41104.1 FAD-dependent oxidoreductase [Actinoplanes ianthinogenes]GGR22888.1 FAD-dependent oxidoreductase [Actinoplanes ianthinogenes]
MPTPRTPVLVVGAGPTGAVLALELARHGVPSLVVERASRPPRHPELNLVGGHTLDLLRRLGVAEALLAAGLDPDGHDTTVWSRSIGRRPVATAPDRPRPDDPRVLVTGTDLAVRLRDAARAHPLIDLREGWIFTDLRLEGGGAVATLLDGHTGTRHSVPADHLAGCDGAQSTVRRCLGVPMDETLTTAHYYTIQFRSDHLARRFPQPATLVADGISLTRCSGPGMWLGHLPLDRGDAETADPIALLHSKLPAALAASQILEVSQWPDPLGVARTYRQGAAYLAGQAAHTLHPPSVAADTCLGDAVDLGWKLAATLGRWAGPALLDSYEQDRRPHAVRDRRLLSRELATRRRFGRLAAAGASRERLAGVLLRDQLRNAGSGAPPRLPTDRLGPQFTLVDVTGSGRGRSLVDTARARGIPMTYLAADDAPLRDRVPGRLLLVRPDQLVAWQSAGDASDWDSVLDRVTGCPPRIT